ncbi:AMP-binding protein [Dactylosporangium matsuzakiense]|uniref:Acyl-CoA synthetase n=1 Tax=Dactylosporangium matsuzakiense TaxID=53360 RepID=A0A9W6KCZ6_9ACTN|nr:AMP-binding protein [Dactylosporangium matsuzakiense]UWZ47107.1 AMP-binding protein [Dactylosporangium matsuzakiense]GLK98458.1 acyl-CoA synthetase [Dactylosporangium matsuzakiense]
MYAAHIARTHPDRLAILMAQAGTRITFGEYEAAANRLARLLRGSGLRFGDHVAMFMENNPRLLESEAAAERSGLYYTCINHYLSPDEAAYIINDSSARIVVTSAAKLDVARQLPQRCPGVERWLMADADDPPAPFESYERAVAAAPDGPIPDEQQGMAMLYSSGTTGRPKGIYHPLVEAHPSEEPPGSRIQRERWGLDEHSVYLSPAPLYHSAPQGSISMTLRAGGTAIVMESFDADRYLELVALHRVTHSQLVPTMLSRLLKLPDERRRAADVSSLRTVVLSSAPCPPQVKRQMIDWWGPIIMEFYAASEGIGYTFCRSQEWLEHPGTVGRAALGELVIRAEDGSICPPGVTGTVWFKGPAGFQYFNDPGRTAATRDPELGASSVGDIGYLDEDGYLYLTDRESFMIISGGVNIYPQETENLLITHEKVDDAAVIGVPDEDFGEAVKAVVQLAAGVEPGPEVEAELIAFCRASIAHFKCPRSVDFVTELPRLPTGKLYKRKLKDAYWAGRESLIR